MFIRQTKTRARDQEQSYFTYRLVESRRIGKKVSQHTLLNLGASFDLPKEDWPELCTRVEQLLKAEEPLFASAAAIEQHAQHIYSQILARRGEIDALEKAKNEQDFHEIDVSSIKQKNAVTVTSSSPF